MAPGLGSLKGRVAVVTGAASGIGRAVALLLAERGARLALADLNAPGVALVVNEVAARGGRALGRHVDVTQPRQVEEFAQEVERALGPAELLVNSAGVVVLAPFAATTLEDWDHVLDVNLRGPLHVCRAFLPAMASRRCGHVVNVASAAAFATQSELAAYGTTKHALVGLSQALADEYAGFGIGVSIVCPGFVDTPILERARVRGDDPDASRRAAARLLRWRRLSPERVAERIVRASERGEVIVPVGLEAEILWLLSRAAPAKLMTLFGRLRLRSRT